MKKLVIALAAVLAIGMFTAAGFASERGGNHLNSGGATGDGTNSVAHNNNTDPQTGSGRDNCNLCR